MKKVYLLTLIIFFSFFRNSFAQIPNADFENWTGTMPDFWISTSGNAYVAPDSNAHSGFLAVRLQTVQGSPVTTTTFSSRVSPGSSYYPTGMSTQPVSIGFWAITNLLNGDMLRFNTTLKNATGNIVAAVTGTCVTTNSSTYQYYSFPFTYSLPGSLADSSATWFSFVHSNCYPNPDLIHNGTFAIIDDFGFDNTTGINQPFHKEIIGTVFPNPANNNAVILYNPYKTGRVEISMNDLTGRRILHHIEFIDSTDEYSLPINLSEIPDGIYFISIFTAEGTKEMKLAVSH